MPEGHRDPRTHGVRDLFCRGGGAFPCPLRSHFSHALVLFPPQVFFFCSLPGPRGPLDCWQHDARLTLILQNASRGLLREYPGNIRERRGVSPKTPAAVWIFDVMEGEMLAVFFTDFFLETVPPILAFFQSSICLSFFGRGFLEMSSVSGFGGLVGKISP